MKVSVRKMRRADKKACVSLLQQLYSHLSSEDLEEKFFWGEEWAYVLLTHGKVVGVAVWEEYDYLPDKSFLLELAAIVIDKGNRLQGFGRELYETSLARVSQTLGVAGIHVLTTIEEVGFYERVMMLSQMVQTPVLLIKGVRYISLLCEI
jgi:GNAT superfamily N-acetyltransferase